VEQILLILVVWDTLHNRCCIMSNVLVLCTYNTDDVVVMLLLLIVVVFMWKLTQVSAGVKIVNPKSYEFRLHILSQG
jgi:hypothetical protein